MLGRHGRIGRSNDVFKQDGIMSMNEGLQRAASVNGGASMSTYVFYNGALTGLTGTVRNVVWGKDGYRAYVTILGGTRTTAAVHQLNLSVPYDLDSKTDPGKSVVVGDYMLNCQAVTFNQAGTKMYVGGYNAATATDERIIEFDLGTSWELDSAVCQVRKLYVGAQEAAPWGFTFRPDGTRLYVVGSIGDDINQYDLSVAWDLYSASFVTSKSVATQATTPYSIAFKDDGLKCYILNNGNDTIYQYSLGTAWDLNGTLTYDNVSLSVATQEATPTGIFIGNNGSSLYVSGSTGDNIVRYNLATAWELGTASLLGESTSLGDTAPYGLFFRDNGATVYSAAYTAGTIRTYNLTGSAWDTGSTNLSFVGAVGPFNSGASSLTSIYIGDNGTKLYWMEQDRLCLYQATLGTAWSVESVQGMALGVTLARYDSILLCDADTKLMVADASQNMRRYTLSTPGRLHTATLDETVNIGGFILNGFTVDADGRKLYAVGTDSYKIARYSLTTPYNLSSRSLDMPTIATAGVFATTQTPDFSSVSINHDATQIHAWCVTTTTGATGLFTWRVIY